MYAIKVDGLFVHSVVPIDTGGLGLTFAGCNSRKCLKFVYKEDAERMVSLLIWHFPYEKFIVVKL